MKSLSNTNAKIDKGSIFFSISAYDLACENVVDKIFSNVYYTAYVYRLDSKKLIT